MKLSEYESRFKYIKLEREDGILQLTLHDRGREARFGAAEGGLHTELPEAFFCINHDPENKVVILTGMGDSFLAQWDLENRLDPSQLNAATWHRIYKEGKELLMNLCDVEVPMIAAVNGNCFIHPELPTMCDIVLASETASFADKGHLSGTGTVPGDGVHIWWPMLLGPNRGRTFLMLGEEISAQEGKALGFVAEVLPPDRLLDRAWELARTLAKNHPLVLRYTRIALAQHIKRRLHDDLGYGLQLEGLGVLASRSVARGHG
ncbi:hypothetical protein CLAIMM_00104 [Cladophialophora immunda]|nr:hypothetical protein CLAIMM_00104 [Cladophialophora immunda]